MIITLAGHVDHGKTTLVRLLTGTDTDRLAEEKRRELTIDLGFAYLQRNDITLGFVDVPGHHRFIHNMVAGVAAMQHALLVIAADDGPMPQSREHLQILSLLGIASGTVALTKCDRVSQARIDRARNEAKALVADTFLADAPVLQTAATGAGIDALRDHLLAHGARARPDAAKDALQHGFRLPVDRAFSLKGVGRVVTGTVHSGVVQPEQTLYTFPGGGPVRVRGLHVQNRPATRAAVGDRTAVNLTGLEADRIGRGDWLTPHPDPGHRNVVVDLTLLDDVARALRHWMPVHVYHATAHSTARLALLDGSRIAPGERGRVELELDSPLLAKRGDRLIVRDQGLGHTLGGGVVLDNRAPTGRRRAKPRLRALDAMAASSPGAALDALLALGPVDPDAFRQSWNLAPEAFQALVAARPVHRRQDELVSDARWQDWLQALQHECEERHRADATLQGLRENAFTAPVPVRFRGELLAALVADGHLQQRAGRYQPRQHRADLTDPEQALMARLTPLLEQAQPPSLGDIGKQLRIPLTQLQPAVKALASKGRVVQVTDKRVYLPGRLLTLAKAAEALSRRGPFTARDYRDAAGIGRNVAIDVLEYFDARGYTRRSNDRRTVVGDRSRLLPGIS